MSRSRIRPRAHRTLVAVAAAAAFALALPSLAAAHSFLIRSAPQGGSRLRAAPRELVLHFSERYVRSSERVSIRRVGDGELRLAAPSGAGRVVRQPLPANLRGVFVVSWRVLSDDGHISLGEFAFAVGSSAALPRLKASTTRTSWPEVATSWLVFIGLALALGGLASERFVWRRTPLNASTLTAAPAPAGVALAVVGSVLQLVLLAGDRRGGGFTAGLNASALSDTVATRPGKLTLALLVALLVAGAMLPLGWLRLAATLPLLAGVGFVAARGHSGTSGHGWAVVADTIHLAAVALWLGALAHLVLVVARGTNARAVLGEGARRYSRFALPTVLVVAASGVLTAIPEFRSVGAVVSSGYGRTLLIKAGLIAVALLLALSARRWALPANPHPRLLVLRRLTVAEATVLAAVLIVAAVLVNAAPPRGPAQAAAPTEQLGPPAVAGPAVQLAGLAGQLGLAVTASAKELRFTVVPPGDQQAGALTLTAEARRPDGRAVDLYPRPCGSACFTIRVRLTRGTTVVRAHLTSSAWRGGTVTFALPWPLPPERPRILRRVAAAMNAARSLTLRETVTSGPGSATPPISYRLSGRAFMKTELFAGGAVDVRPLAHAGRLTELAFALPGSNIWYRMTIDRSYRIRRETILSPGHRIRRTFAYPPGSGAVPAGTATPRPPDWPFVLAREDDDLAVGLAARLNGRRLALVVTVLHGEGHGATGLRLAFRLRAGRATTSAQMARCGAGCYRADPILTGKPRSLTLRVERLGHSPALLRFPFPQHWPPPAATALVRRATAVFRRLHSLMLEERIASSSRAVVRDTWTLVAPNRATFRIVGGSEAIIIGARRWDRNPGKRWQRSTTSPLQTPWVPWGSAPARASLLGSGRVDGRAVWLVSFFDPDGPTWVELAIDKKTLRTLELRLVATSHFMHHRYSAFNRPFAIKPPR